MNPYLSVFRCATDHNPAGKLRLADVIRRIQSQELAPICARIREVYAAHGGGKPGKDAIKPLKVPLPAVTPAGMFEYGDDAGWRVPSEYVGVDVDCIGDAEGLAKTWETLRGLPWIAAAWHSPSGDGIKALARVPGLLDPTEAGYKTRWHAVTACLAGMAIVNDARTTSPSLLAFLAHDPQAWHNADATEFPLADWIDRVPVEPPAGEVYERSEHPAPAGAVESAYSHIVERLPLSISGEGGSGVLMRAIRDCRDGFELSQEQTRDVIARWNETRAEPKWSERELNRAVNSVEKKAPKQPPGWLLPNFPDEVAAEAAASGLHVVAASELVAAHPSYKTPVVDGLLREGETMNIIAAPKIGKSWLALLLVFCIANGVPFLGRRCAKGPVLILDNELHPETAAQRLRTMANATGLSLDGIHLMSLRGQLEDLPRLAKRIVDAALAIGAKVIVLDALYRLLPASTSENDNAGMMQLYNCIDRIARNSGAAIVCIHHSSKGNQGEKSITDGGAGAGSIARAADCHLFLREHEDAGRVVVDAVARSWPPPASIVIERPDLVWQVAVGADASRIKGRAVQRAANVPADDVLQYVAAKPEPIVTLMARLESANVRASRSRVEGVLALAVNEGRIVCETGPRNAKLYGREASVDAGAGTQVERVRRYKAEHPKASQAEIAATIGCDARTVRRAMGGS